MKYGILSIILISVLLHDIYFWSVQCYCLNLRRFQNRKIETKLYTNRGGSSPSPQNVRTKSKIFNSFIATSLITVNLVTMLSPSKSIASDTNFVIDKSNNFALIVPSSFSIMKNKIPSPAISKYTVEETLLTATSFNDFSSLSVTKTIAPRLLKDFNIDWWFAPLNTISEVGSPDLIAKLLILQRQYDFENKKSSSVVTQAYFPSSTSTEPSNFAKASENENNVLYFVFKTPTGNNDNNSRIRYTIAKAYFKDNTFYVLWVSSSKTDIDEQSIHKYDEILNSFHII